MTMKFRLSRTLTEVGVGTDVTIKTSPRAILGPVKHNLTPDDRPIGLWPIQVMVRGRRREDHDCDVVVQRGADHLCSAAGRE